MTRQQYIDAVKVKLEEISPFDEPDSFIADGDDAAETVKPIISYIEQSLDEAAHNCLRSLPLTLLHADIETTTGTLSIDVNGVGVIRPLSTAWRFVRLRQDLLQRDITAFISSEDPLYMVQQDKDVRGGVCKPVAVIASDGDGSYSGQMEIYSFPESVRNTNTEQYVLLSINTHKHADDRNCEAYVVYNNKKYYYVGVSAQDFDQWESGDNNVIFTYTSASGNTRPVYSGPNSSAATGSSTTSYKQAVVDNEYVKSPIEEFIVLECSSMVEEILGDVQSSQLCRQQYQAKLQATLQ